MRKCITCDGLLLSNSAKEHPEQKYCSHKCYVVKRYGHARLERDCLLCGKHFWYYASRGTVKFCSHKCYAKAPASDETRKKRAHHGANHPNWKGGVMKGRKDRNLAVYKEWRNAVFARDRYTCQWCGAKNHKGRGITVRLEADHLYSWTEFPEYRYKVNNGRTLCGDCHTRRTAQQHRERMAYV